MKSVESLLLLITHQFQETTLDALMKGKHTTTEDDNQTEYYPHPSSFPTLSKVEKAHKALKSMLRFCYALFTLKL